MRGLTKLPILRDAMLRIAPQDEEEAAERSTLEAAKYSNLILRSRRQAASRRIGHGRIR
jgi:hypothetical protein